MQVIEDEMRCMESFDAFVENWRDWQKREPYVGKRSTVQDFSGIARGWRLEVSGMQEESPNPMQKNWLYWIGSRGGSCGW
jgi:hypothetical protein